VKPWADSVEERLTRHQGAIENAHALAEYPKRSRLADDRLSTQIESIAYRWVHCPLGTIVSNRTVSSQFLLTLPGNYTTGGYPQSALLIPAVPNQTSVVVQPFGAGTPYTFAWNATTLKLQVFTAAGAEVANGTNLSAVQNWPAVVYGAATAMRPVHRSTEVEAIHQVDIEVSQLIEKDPDSWQISVRRVNALNPMGEIIGAHDTSVFKLPAGEAVTIFKSGPDVQPFLLMPDDRVSVVLYETPSPFALQDFVVWLKMRRRV